MASWKELQLTLSVMPQDPRQDKAAAAYINENDYRL